MNRTLRTFFQSLNQTIAFCVLCPISTSCLTFVSAFLIVEIGVHPEIKAGDEVGAVFSTTSRRPRRWMAVEFVMATLVIGGGGHLFGERKGDAESEDGEEIENGEEKSIELHGEAL
ncbi:hypothetical protein F5882DRAFT_469557 [Hyaloscypha sp. PMI_1271]|nr:hypothetical protein F5882DRAFT_469557 [Hyaloscypha sp. PMI_1271]